MAMSEEKLVLVNFLDNEDKEKGSFRYRKG